MQVGFVGVGRMGAPMVGRLVEAGHDVCAFGRSDERLTEITALGALAAKGLPVVADGADVVVLCVFTDEQVRQVCIEDGLLGAMAPGSVLVVHTTGSPTTVGELAGATSGVDVLDAPVSGGPHDVAAGHVTLFVGGGDRALERARPVLASYADPILHVGPGGSGQMVKLVNNALFAAQIGVVAEGVRLGAAFGVDEGLLLDALTHGSSQSRVSSMIAAAGSADAFLSAVGEFIGKDVAFVRRTAAELGADLGILGAAIDAGSRPDG